MSQFEQVIENGVESVELESLLKFSIDLDQLRKKLLTNISGRINELEAFMPYDDVIRSHKSSLLAKGITSHLGRNY